MAPGTTEADVEDAIADGRIIRTWPMRGTLHFVAAGDVRWIRALLAPRAIARSAGRHAQLGLTDADFARARELLTGALVGGVALPRAEAMALLESGGMDTAGQRGYHILVFLAQDGLLCLGPMQARQQTFVLLDEWVPPAAGESPAPDRGEVLARLASRYFEAHGPATLSDFAWWAGITKTDARVGLEAASRALECVKVDGAEHWVQHDAVAASGPSRSAPPGVHLLPGFDEYMLGYTDRSLQLGEHRDTYGSAVSANGAFSSTLVVDGRIAGTWKRALKRDRVEIAVRMFRDLTPSEHRGLATAIERYGRFVGKEATVV